MARILIADDNAEVREAIRVMLEEAGLEVVEAKDGKEALGELRSRRVDLVLCDVFMPDVDGLEVIRTLRKEFPQLKVVAMSGGGSKGLSDVLPIAMRLGAAEVLYKPFDQSRLLKSILQLLGGPPPRSVPPR
jgi:CheY-like chemotaxis protein